MKYLVSWTYRLNGTAAENEISLRRGLAVFSKWAPPASSTYHAFLGRVDSGGGFALIETDDPADLVDVSAKFTFIADYQIHPVVDIDQSAQALQQGVDFLESIQT
ncbi:DUF3303 domain-containing protein [Mycobacterium asiaticum]|uniref:DUF3303 domain-containing protein n=1 Tax=Mycobacterium asiaticum TaxID=1790 RepID=UPI0005665654|nr:DUF3303 family protein [Mycobacterium asiaticum]ORA13336.1 DUF3303 domain-containing protein [Mycobacterium asiaticum DSM 44297]